MANVSKIETKREFKPKGKNQEEYIRAVAEYDLVFAIGPAGSGKTSIATAMALRYLLDPESSIDKIIITRPTINTDESGIDKGIGFLPGSLMEKMQVWMLPILDEFKTYFTKEDLNRLLYDNLIEVAPLCFMRGRNFHNAFVIGDEMQNASFNQIQMLCTRLGRSSKMILTGDIEQHDRHDDKSDFQIWTDDIIGFNDEQVPIVKLDTYDIVRHDVVKHIVNKARRYNG